MIYVGIDPGLKGGIAAVDEHGKLEYADPMPVAPMRLSSGKERNIVSWVMLRPYVRRKGIVVVGIERVWSMLGERETQAHQFGDASGTVKGAFGVAHRVDIVLPKQWQKVYGLPGGPEGKALAIELASEMWPDKAHVFARKDEGSGCADASLIAEHMRLKEQTK